MSIITMNELNLIGKRVLIRADLNVPIQSGIVTSAARIRAVLPTIQLALKKGASVIIASHLGRPTEGKYDKHFSLLPVVNYLKSEFGKDQVTLNADYLNGIHSEKKTIIVLENVRFNKGEKNNDPHLSRKYAALCDIFVMDAFGTAHRTEASTCGVSQFALTSCAGPLLLAELEALEKVLTNPARPMVAVIGGSKISTKFDILRVLAKISDTVIVGGGIANTFIAIDNQVGKSLYEPDYLPIARTLRNNFSISIPIDVRVKTGSSKTSISVIKKISEVKKNEEILDLGNQTELLMVKLLKSAKTILWNGPVGLFEHPDFRHGTEIIAHTIADSNAFSIAGGGDTLAAIDLFKIQDKISYISTGGGAFLQVVAGKELPAVSILKERANNLSHR
ncbi:phosphoglycerate kinase [Candidatus Erwinia haradaeae]|uniref:Phosphoglycerate kinase n=1 Tax=Candidatus Erwinia haradaeae TaxID=1922217 RepID=A0A451D4A7_9GAMM|nr:phosphoglycerate kinase [Candidatus Erwinia haradaeae]VFP80451.1 Phosphoglycerate kinase [Candidatus Erwinia haradaeae]